MTQPSWPLEESVGGWARSTTTAAFFARTVFTGPGFLAGAAFVVRPLGTEPAYDGAIRPMGMPGSAHLPGADVGMRAGQRSALGEALEAEIAVVNIEMAAGPLGQQVGDQLPDRRRDLVPVPAESRAEPQPLDGGGRDHRVVVGRDVVAPGIGGGQGGLGKVGEPVGELGDELLDEPAVGPVDVVVRVGPLGAGVVAVAD